MQLTLTVMRDNKLIETITLNAPKEASFGRKCAGGLADKQFSDEKLSRHHFRICPEGSGWRLEDLRSRNGTHVQGKLVNACLLIHGDEINAGRLTFRVGIIGIGGGSGQPTSEYDRNRTPASQTDPDGIYEIAALASRGKLKMLCSIEKGESGQTFFRGELMKVKSAAELVLGLRQSKTLGHPWLVVDPSRLEFPMPESLAETATPIVDWLSPVYAESISPRLIDLDDVPFPEWDSLVADAWDQDVLFVLFSDQKQDELLDVLRKAAHHGSAISGVLWSSVMSYMLLKAQSGPAAQVMSACSAILMEVPDLPGNWLLIGPPTLQRSLEKLGMMCSPTLADTKTQSDE